MSEQEEEKIKKKLTERESFPFDISVKELHHHIRSDVRALYSFPSVFQHPPSPADIDILAYFAK